MKLDPNYLNIAGQILNLIGGLFLTVDALGALEFMKQLEAKDNVTASRMARLGFVASTNSVLVYIFVCFLGFILAIILLPSNRVVLGLLLAPFTYPVWKLFVHIGELLQKLVERVGPHHYFAAKGCFSQIIQFLLLIPWSILFLSVALVAILLRFGLDLPLRWLSERVVGRFILLVFHQLATVQETERRFFFRKNAFVGLIFVLFGFAYQLMATIVQMLTATAG